jgi:hypothetical protein
MKRNKPRREIYKKPTIQDYIIKELEMGIKADYNRFMDKFALDGSGVEPPEWKAENLCEARINRKSLNEIKKEMFSDGEIQVLFWKPMD